VQNIRAFGSETELQQVQQEIADIMGGPTGLRNSIELTHENMRLGAIQGILLDADGTVIRNWFTEFGISQPAEIDFDLDNASPVRCRAQGVQRRRAQGDPRRGRCMGPEPELRDGPVRRCVLGRPDSAPGRSARRT
jgi:hypothetical protein